jgi:hypothetical protein
MNSLNSLIKHIDFERSKGTGWDDPKLSGAVALSEQLKKQLKDENTKKYGLDKVLGSGVTRDIGNGGPIGGIRPKTK